MGAKLETVLRKMREICLALPNTREGDHFGDCAFYVGRKLFATCGDKHGRCQIVVGLELDHAEALVANDPRFTAYPRDKRAVVLDASQVKDWSEVRLLVEESYRLATATKKPKRAAAPEAPKFFATPAAFRAWLEQHHERETELLVGFYKRDSGKPSMTWPESVDEALCFGWIDGVRRSLGDEAYSIRFTPRKPRSIWSAVNVAKIEALRKAGKLHPNGLKAYEARTPERTAVYSFERKTAAELPEAFAKRLQANKRAARYFAEQAPWYQRATIHWVISAKREETRERRMAQLIECSAACQQIGVLTRPDAKKAKR